MTCPGMRGDTSALSCAKWLNRSTCRLGCELRWVERRMCYLGARWRHLANTIEPSVCGDAALWQNTLTTSFSFDRPTVAYRGLSYCVIDSETCMSQSSAIFWFDSISQLPSIAVARRLRLPEIGDMFNHSILITSAENCHVVSRKRHYLRTGIL